MAATTPAIRALLRNTVAMTQLEGSAADNVMPSSVRAVINLRLLPPWTVETATERIKSVIADDKVCVTVYGLATNPIMAGSEQALQKGPGWKEINTAIASSFPGIPSLPFLMPATTDSRHYKDITRHIFRFNPQILTQEEQGGVHGHDERISPENLEQGHKFYTALMEQL
jgi:carboxypeptidase PM20D1